MLSTLNYEAHLYYSFRPEQGVECIGDAGDGSRTVMDGWNHILQGRVSTRPFHKAIIKTN